MSKNLKEELNRMRTLAGLMQEGSEQETANQSAGAQKPPMQTQSPSVGSPQIQKFGQTPKAKQPSPQEIESPEEIEELLDDASDYPPIEK